VTNNSLHDDVIVSE